MEIIDDGFMLLDSDILVKKDFTPLYDGTKVFVGKGEKMKTFKKRVEPFMCYINTKMCKEHNIHYYDENHMLGFYESNGGENYDTGCWFYEACKNLPKREITTAPYMIHFRAASWYKEAVEKQNYKKMSPDKWLEMNKKYWSDEPAKPLVTEKGETQAVKKEENNKPEPEKPKPSPEEKVMPVEKKKEAEVKYLKMAKTSDRKIGVLNR